MEPAYAVASVVYAVRDTWEVYDLTVYFPGQHPWMVCLGTVITRNSVLNFQLGAAIQRAASNASFFFKTIF